jgi:hypothetical protein
LEHLLALYVLCNSVLHTCPDLVHALVVRVFKSSEGYMSVKAGKVIMSRISSKGLRVGDHVIAACVRQVAVTKLVALRWVLIFCALPND